MHIAAKQLGWTHLAVIQWDTSDVQAIAFAIADNRTAELATWNEPVLGDLLADLQIDHAEIDHMLSDLRSDIAARGLATDNPEPEPIQYQVLVKCPNEQTQRELLERFQAAGYTCRCTFA